MANKNFVWIMNAYSESGDDYPVCKIWDHKPSNQEIDAVRVELDSTEFDPEFDREDNEGFIILDCKKYISYILNYDVYKREIATK